ncbi:MAG: hypothetical protein JST10_06855 [Bacteroidetes bacterium]|nr:hypothetical protein [Bacteroidota bacterium]MBS1632278.1 hypothetical protein [Bacteroidota bacterium]
MKYGLSFCFIFLTFISKSQISILQGDSVLLAVQHKFGDEMINKLIQDYGLKRFNNRTYYNDSKSFLLGFNRNDSVDQLAWITDYEKKHDSGDTLIAKPFPYQLPFQLTTGMRMPEIMEILKHQGFDVEDRGSYIYFQKGRMEISIFRNKYDGISTLQVLKKSGY